MPPDEDEVRRGEEAGDAPARSARLFAVKPLGARLMTSAPQRCDDQKTQNSLCGRTRTSFQRLPSPLRWTRLAGSFVIRRVRSAFGEGSRPSWLAGGAGATMAIVEQRW